MSVRAAGREGFALLAVLWMLAGLSVLALTVALAGRQATHAARNRAALARARWEAAGCSERARAAVAEVLGPARPGVRADGATAWDAADRSVAASMAGGGCEVKLRAAGARVDVNTADAETLHRLLGGSGVPGATADSMVDALADWRDADERASSRGAERPWYRARGRLLPRNGPIADLRELRRVRGWNEAAGLDTLLDVDSARVPLNHAPPAVLASLPGFGGEAVSRLLELRSRGGGVTDLAAFSSSLSPGARQALERSFAALASRVVLEPDAWIVTSRARVGAPPVSAVVEVWLVRAGHRAAVVRRRTWIE